MAAWYWLWSELSVLVSVVVVEAASRRCSDSAKDCSMSFDFSERMKKKTTVMDARKREVNSQPMICLPKR